MVRIPFAQYPLNGQRNGNDEGEDDDTKHNFNGKLSIILEKCVIIFSSWCFFLLLSVFLCEIWNTSVEKCAESK